MMRHQTRNSALKWLILAILLNMIFGVKAQETPNISDKDSSNYIMFTSDASFAYSDIYALNPQDKTIIPLVVDALAQYPVWSFANGELAFVSGQIYDDIFILNPEQQTLVNLTQNEAHEIYPRWSPDGQKIAFATNVTGDYEVFVINRDSSNLMNISNSPDASDGTWGLDWSPDNSQIVFTSNRNGRTGIYVMSEDGSNQQLLLSNDPPSEDRYPTWSPDGSKIAFVSMRLAGEGVYVVNGDGSELTYLSSRQDVPPTGRHWSVSWSPDGQKIVLQINTRESLGIQSEELYLANADGSNQIRLTKNERYEAYPSWISSEAVESGAFPISLSEIIQRSPEIRTCSELIAKKLKC